MNACFCRRTHLSLVGPLNMLEDMLARFGIVNEWIALGAVNQLEVLCAWLPVDRLLGHAGEWREQRVDAGAPMAVSV